MSYHDQGYCTLLIMPVCLLCSKKCKIQRYDSRLLEGDTFYDYYCPECSNTKEGTFERHQLSWQTVIHLVLYHLQRTSSNGNIAQNGVKYFRWKEDICGFIERHWEDLIPQKNPGVSWQNSVSSVLSAHHEVFSNGLEVKGETGWWALKQCEPPRVKTMGTGLSITPSVVSKRPRCDSDEQDNDDEIKSEAGSIDLMLEGERNETDEVDNEEEQVQGEGNIDTAKDPPKGTSEQIKKQLLSRLLSVDSSILKQALSKVKEDHQQQQQQQQIPKYDTSSVSTSQTPSTQPKAPRTKLVSARAPPVENELLRILSRIKNPDSKMRRLRRKLISRRERRRAGIDLFDLDTFIYNYLKDPKPFDDKGEYAVGSGGSGIDVNNTSQQLQIVTPYHTNKYLSLKFRVLGMSACLSEPFPCQFTSPFSGRPLPAFISRDSDCFVRSARGQLMHSLTRLFTQPSNNTVDFIHLRREYVPQLNRLLSAFFWPNIDVTESADFPDYSILAVYNTWLIVGAALLDPDGYLSHLFVRPDWSNAGIGHALLLHSLHSAPPRDITLHCSATNPAMLLYNQFGFKPEQYIVGHYEKHYAMAEQSEECRALSTVLPFSKNAFLMRLRR